MRYFSEDITATTTSQFTKINRPTINKLYTEIRENIAGECERNSVFERGEMEFDESYFGARRVGGKRGRGGNKKIPVFGILKRDGRGYTKILEHCSKAEIYPIIESKADMDSIVYSDGYSVYDGFADDGYKKHYRVKYSANQFAEGRNHNQ